MLIVSGNLLGIVKTFDICPAPLVEEFSIKILLDRTVRRMRDNPLESSAVRYGATYDPDCYFAPEERISGELVLKPGQNVLACSQHPYSMPPGYFGLVQTKGSLARLFVAVTANDGQVEPGYNGKITLEMTNFAKFPVILSPEDEIAQLFIFRCSSDVSKPYSGRYQHASKPTLATFP